MTDADTRRWQASPQVLVQALGSDTVLVHLGTDRIFELNATASRLWSLLESGRTLLESRALLLDEFNVPETVLDEELRRTFDTFVDERLLAPHAG